MRQIGFAVKSSVVVFVCVEIVIRSQRQSELWVIGTCCNDLDRATDFYTISRLAIPA